MIVLLCVLAFIGSFLVLGQDSSSAVYWRAGTITVGVLDTSKAVTFSIPMTGTNYIVIMSSSEIVPLGCSSKTANGFTINMALGLSGTVDWVAIPPN